MGFPADHGPAERADLVLMLAESQPLQERVDVGAAQFADNQAVVASMTVKARREFR